MNTLRISFLVSFLGALLTLLMSAASFAADLHSVQILDVHYNGAGCPAGSVDTTFSPDNAEFSILYDAFTMQVGGQTGQTTDAKNCEVQIHMHVPYGYAVNVDSADFRGFVGLDSGVFAEQNVNHQFGSNRFATYGFGAQIFAGPRQENYFLRSIRPTTRLSKLLQCFPVRQDTNLSIRTHIKMTGGNSSHQGLMTVDSTDGKVEQHYKVSLRSCF